jgi:hypothetical protein
VREKNYTAPITPDGSACAALVADGIRSWWRYARALPQHLSQPHANVNTFLPLLALCVIFDLMLIL